MFADRTAILFILTTFASGLCGSFFYPLSSVFMVEHLGATPYMLSAYMILAVVSSVVMSQFIAYNSDKSWRRKRILLVAFSCYFITVVSFAFLDNYYVAVGIAFVFGSVSGAIYGQLFALGREYADEHLEESGVTFLSTMRAGMAVAWVFGPPIAFILKGAFGFSASFLASATMVVVTILVVYFFLPDGETTKNTESSENVDFKWYKNAPILLLSVALLAMFAANNLYITSMPLYFSQELSIGASWAGMLFGCAALCEIPIMLKAGRLSERFGVYKLLLVASVVGTLFYMGMAMANQVWQFFALQIVNGIFVGIIATLGMVALQDRMKHQLGVASTLFSNLMQVSILLSSVSVGLVAQKYNYHSTLYVSFGATACAFMLMGYFYVTFCRNNPMDKKLILERSQP
ncbi:sugar efflux transporter [Vibrio tapetis subsp. quintayensis]|uniref:sugar efflux transporter n=1 Tax=Vibrio tapetis TaxID=52443 RepID=UPI0025B61FD8|nr:sugar efflux transporter [Vibrio tapetis]MDN3682198.1 sugar efflux transporter [Vibrio tapetis subsp. quintayensis]